MMSPRCIGWLIFIHQCSLISIVIPTFQLATFLKVKNYNHSTFLFWTKYSKYNIEVVKMTWCKNRNVILLEFFTLKTVVVQNILMYQWELNFVFPLLFWERLDQVLFLVNINLNSLAHLAIIFNIKISWVILTISCGEIKGKMSKLLMWWDQRKNV